MTFEQIQIREQVTREMNRRFPQGELSYRNGIVGHAIAIGKKAKLTEDWLRKALLGDVEDGFLTYGQAVAIKERYMEAIETVKRMF